jgi:site-specific recombinase XerD
MRSVQRPTPIPAPVAVEKPRPSCWEETVTEFLAAQMRLMREEGTMRNYRWVLRGRAQEFADEAGLATVGAWTEAVFERFLSELAALRGPQGSAGLSASTINIHYRVTKQFLRWCAKRGYLHDRAVLDTPAPKGPQLLPRSIDPEATRRLLSVTAFARTADGTAAFNSRDRGRDGVIVELMVRCGVRRCEIPLMTLDSLVQTSRGDWLLRVFGKGNKERMIPLDTPKHAMSKVLRDYIRRIRPQDTDRRELFLSARKRGGGYEPLTRSGVGQLVARLSRRTALHGPRVKFTPHQLRHTFATRTLEAGAAVSELQRALGHTTPVMSLRYAKATDEDLIAAWKRRTD